MTRLTATTSSVGQSAKSRNRKDSDESTLNPVGFYGTVANLPVGGNSAATSVADFNRDGIQDLVVTLSSAAVSNNLAVFLGSGNGSFGSAVQLSSEGLNTLSVITGDFNQDDIPDIVTANLGSDTVSLLLGNGNGGFQTAQTFRVGGQPNAVASGDFNQDGRLDLVTANSETGENSLSLLLANGTGGFSSATSLKVEGERPFAVATGDLDRDGNLDIVSADSVSGSVSVFLGNGNGTFEDAKQYAVGGTTPISIVLGYFDDDNKLDIATGNQGVSGRDISILYGDGNGKFSEGRVFSAGGSVSSLASADFNGDGAVDLAAVLSDSPTVSMLFGDGEGQFNRTRGTSIGTLPGGLSVADFDRDGKPDLVTTSGNTTNASVILNKTTYVVLRSTEKQGEIDGSQEKKDSIVVNLDTGRLTINTSPTVVQVAVDDFRDVLGTQVKDNITGSNASNSLSGNNGQDTLLGLGGKDTMLGGQGRDQMKGGAGDDKLTGGLADDKLTGNEGRDRFIFDHGTPFSTQDGKDNITDFEQGRDKIVLDRSTFTALSSKVSFESVSSLADAKNSDALITYLSSNGRLYYNANGAAAGFDTGGWFATISNAKNNDLTAADFSTQA